MEHKKRSTLSSVPPPAEPPSSDEADLSDDQDEELSDEEQDHPHPQEDDPQEDDDDDVDSDTDNFTIKPILSQPSTKAKKSKSTDKQNPKGHDDEEKKINNWSGGAATSNIPGRIWSPKDELAMLQGLIDYKRKHKTDPYSNKDEFFTFVKDRLQYAFVKTQVKDKMRRVRDKYTNCLRKSLDGKEPVFSDPHEIKFFQLAKQFWGPLASRNAGFEDAGAKENADAKENDGANEGVKEYVVGMPAGENGKNGGDLDKSKSSKRSRSDVKKMSCAVEEGGTRMEADEAEEEEGKKVETVEGDKEFSKMYPHLMAAFENDAVPRVPLLKGFKSCLSVADSSDLEEWNRRWKKVRVAEEEAYLNRVALVAEQTRWFMNDFNSFKS